VNSFRRRLALIEKATPASPPPAIFVCFTGCSPVRAEALDGRIWQRDADEVIEDFEKRVRADLPSGSAVPSVVIFFHEP
jgi:hypothetical protein